MKKLHSVLFLTFLPILALLAQPAPVTLFSGSIPASSTTNLAAPKAIHVPNGKHLALQVAQTHAAAQTLASTTLSFDV